MKPRDDASAPAERPASARFGWLSLRRMTIRSKAYLGLAALVGGVLLFVGGYYPARLASEFSRRLEAETDAAATLLAHHLAPAADFEDRRAASQGIGGVTLLRDVEYVGVFTRTGALLAEQGQPSGRARVVPPADGLRRTAARLILTRRIRGMAGEVQGTLVLESSLARLHARRKEDLTITAMFGAAILIFGLFVAYMLERFVVRPINRVTRSVERVASAAEDPPEVPVESDDEAGQLARAFNAMRERLQRTTVSRDHLESVLGSVADMLFVVDARGIVRSVNRVTLTALDLPEAQIVGRPLAELIDEDVAPLLVGVRQRGQVRDRAVTLVGKTGVRVPAMVNGATVRGPQAESGAIVLLARDMTEMRRLLAAEARAHEQQLRAVELARAYADLAQAHEQLKDAQARLVQSGKLAAVGELAAGVAHEMNNPLSAVLTYAVLLDRKMAALPAPTRDQLSDFGRQLSLIRVGAERCKAISDNLLAFSRGSEAPMASVAVAAVVARTFELIGADLRFKRVHVTREVPDGLAVWGSDGELQQVLTNLLMNAAQAAGEGGHVSVAARAAGGDAVTLEVRDDGPGMSPEVQERIFEPFFTTKPLGEGTGLGLSIVHGIVRKHRGQVAVQSAPGEGTSFCITLRVAPPAAGSPPGASG